METTFTPTLSSNKKESIIDKVVKEESKESEERVRRLRALGYV